MGHFPGLLNGNCVFDAKWESPKCVNPEIREGSFVPPRLLTFSPAEKKAPLRSPFAFSTIGKRAETSSSSVFFPSRDMFVVCPSKENGAPGFLNSAFELLRF